MGRPPCCDKQEVKKGPWTPEEDIMLVSYVQQHGPGNWRQVPANTGLRRCSKSCRLRWTNYLRPGIRRGDFTNDEEKMIIQLQALLGNKWAAIASYLPERTDNDIKNYWNTHLKKKLRKLQIGSNSSSSSQHDLAQNTLIPTIKDRFSSSTSSSSSISRGQWEKKLQTDIHMAKQALNDALSIPQTEKSTPQTSTYPSSTENIAKLLKGFIKTSPKNPKTSPDSSVSNSNSCDEMNLETKTSGIDLSEAFESLFGFDQPLETPDNSDFSQSNTSPEGSISKPEIAPLTMFENWLLDEANGGAMDEEENADLTDFSFDENPNFFDN